MITPRGNWLLIKAVEKKELQTVSGFYVSENWDVAPESLKGEVVAVGPQVTDLKVGDIVLSPQYAPTRAYELPTDKTFIVNADDVLAVITSDKAAK